MPVTKPPVDEILPIVDGEIEVIEVKSYHISPFSKRIRQRKNPVRRYQSDVFREIVMNGYKLRWYQVTILSFEKNEFKVEEKLLGVEA